MDIKVIATGSTRWQRFIRRWGVSFLVDGDILFDTFGHPAVFARNIRRFDIDLGAVKHIVISHDDWDHISGLWQVLEHYRGVTVIVCPNAGRVLKERIASFGVRVVEAASPFEIKPGVYTTGELTGRARGEPICEQALVLRTVDGLAVVAGCAHPGIETIVERVREKFGEDVSLVLGGFHLKDASCQEIDRVVMRLRTLRVVEAMPMHCTGRRAVRAFARAFPGRCFCPSSGALLSV